MNKRKLQYVALLISVLLIAIISLANMQTVTVNFLLVQFKTPAHHFDSGLCPSRFVGDFLSQPS